MVVIINLKPLLTALITDEAHHAKNLTLTNASLLDPFYYCQELLRACNFCLSEQVLKSLWEIVKACEVRIGQFLHLYGVLDVQQYSCRAENGFTARQISAKQQ